MRKLFEYIVFSSITVFALAAAVRSEAAISCFFSTKIKIYGEKSRDGKVLKTLSPESRIDFMPGRFGRGKTGWEQIDSYTPKELLDRNNIRPRRIVERGRRVPMYIFLTSSDLADLECVSPDAESNDPRR